MHGCVFLDSLDLPLDRLSVGWRLDSEGGCLVADQHADEADDTERHENADEHGGTAPQPHSAEQVHEWRQDERQNDGERDWDQNVLSDVKRSDDDGGDGNRQEAPDFGS